MQRTPFFAHEPIHFAFNQSREDFFVTEHTSVTFSGKGGYLIIKLKRTNLSTWECVDILSEHFGCESSQIGYGGLKDKQSTSIQYFSLPKNSVRYLKSFHHHRIEIIDDYIHDEKLKLGDVKSNAFEVVLHFVKPQDSTRIATALEEIVRFGFANYFGYQRFGVHEHNDKQIQDFIDGSIEIKDAKLAKMLLAAYQSKLFNAWLANRVALSQKLYGLDAKAVAKILKISLEDAQDIAEQNQPFKVFKGDVLYSAVTHRWQNCIDVKSVKKNIKAQKLFATGLMPGKSVWRAKEFAQAIEEKFDDIALNAKGDRRIAWVFAKKVTHTYDSDNQTMRLGFTLPKSVYATVLLEAIAHRDLTPKPRR